MATRTVNDYVSNSAWVARMKSLFDFVDLNKNGTMEIDDWIRYVDNINREVKPDSKLYENLRQAMLNNIAAMGVTPGKKLAKDEFVKNIAEMAVKENAKRAKGERTYLDILENSWYKVVDANHDGYVSLNEYRTVMTACTFSPEEAEAGFHAMDTNKNGKVELKELIEHEFNYWFGLSDDQSSKGMFGAKFDN